MSIVGKIDSYLKDKNILIESTDNELSEKAESISEAKRDIINFVNDCGDKYEKMVSEYSRLQNELIKLIAGSTSARESKITKEQNEVILNVLKKNMTDPEDLNSHLYDFLLSKSGKDTLSWPSYKAKYSITDK